MQQRFVLSSVALRYGLGLLSLALAVSGEPGDAVEARALDEGRKPVGSLLSSQAGGFHHHHHHHKHHHARDESVSPAPAPAISPAMVPPAPAAMIPPAPAPVVPVQPGFMVAPAPAPPMSPVPAPALPVLQPSAPAPPPEPPKVYYFRGGLSMDVDFDLIETDIEHFATEFKLTVQSAINCVNCVEVLSVTPGSITVTFKIKEEGGRPAEDFAEHFKEEVGDPASALYHGALAPFLHNPSFEGKLILVGSDEDRSDKETIDHAVNSALDGWEKRIQKTVNKMHSVIARIDQQTRYAHAISQQVPVVEDAMKDFIVTTAKNISKLDGLASSLVPPPAPAPAPVPGPVLAASPFPAPPAAGPGATPGAAPGVAPAAMPPAIPAGPAAMPPGPPA